MKFIYVLFGITHCILKNKKFKAPFFIEEIEKLQEQHRSKLKKSKDDFIKRFIENCQNKQNISEIKLNIESCIPEILLDSVKESIQLDACNFIELFIKGIDEDDEKIINLTNLLCDDYNKMHNNLINKIKNLSQSNEINTLADLDKINKLRISNDHYSVNLYIIEQNEVNKKFIFDEYCLFNPFTEIVIEKEVRDEKRNLNTIILQKLNLLNDPNNFNKYIDDLSLKNKVLIEYFYRIDEFSKGLKDKIQTFMDKEQNKSKEKIIEFINHQVECIALGNEEMEKLRNLVQINDQKLMDEFEDNFEKLKIIFENFLQSYKNIYDKILSKQNELRQFISNLKNHETVTQVKEMKYIENQIIKFLIDCPDINQLICDTDYNIRKELKFFCDVFDFEDKKNAEYLINDGYNLNLEKFNEMEDKKLGEAKKLLQHIIQRFNYIEEAAEVINQLKQEKFDKKTYDDIIKNIENHSAKEHLDQHIVMYYTFNFLHPSLQKISFLKESFSITDNQYKKVCNDSELLKKEKEKYGEQIDRILDELYQYGFDYLNYLNCLNREIYENLCDTYKALNINKTEKEVGYELSIINGEKPTKKKGENHRKDSIEASSVEKSKSTCDGDIKQKDGGDTQAEGKKNSQIPTNTKNPSNPKLDSKDLAINEAQVNDNILINFDEKEKQSIVIQNISKTDKDIENNGDTSKSNFNKTNIIENPQINDDNFVINKTEKKSGNENDNLIDEILKEIEICKKNYFDKLNEKNNYIVKKENKEREIKEIQLQIEEKKKQKENPVLQEFLLKSYLKGQYAIKQTIGIVSNNIKEDELYAGEVLIELLKKIEDRIIGKQNISIEDAINIANKIQEINKLKNSYY